MMWLWLALFACDPGPPPEAAPSSSSSAASATATATATLPPRTEGASLYSLDLPVLNQAGEGVRLDVGRGQPVLLSMFYTSCPMACPLLIQDIQSIEAELSPRARAALRVVLVSLDPTRDDPAALRAVVEQHGLDGRWTLGAVPEDRVIEVAAALHVRYRPLEGGGFAHTSVLTLVDGEGRIVARSEGAEGRAALQAAIESLSRGP